MIKLNTDKFQQYIGRPYLPTRMRRLESMSQILTCLSMSQEDAAVAAPNNEV